MKGKVYALLFKRHIFLISRLLKVSNSAQCFLKFGIQIESSHALVVLVVQLTKVVLCAGRFAWWCSQQEHRRRISAGVEVSQGLQPGGHCKGGIKPRCSGS